MVKSGEVIWEQPKENPKSTGRPSPRQVFGRDRSGSPLITPSPDQSVSQSGIEPPGTRSSTVISQPACWAIHCDTPRSAPRLNDVADSTTIATSRAESPVGAALVRMCIGIPIS
jgi:hypothetical protein